jgi:vacuolar-type H+-ATPase subunit H
LEYTLAKGQEEALSLITQSKLEAEKIIAEARQKAQQILSQAQRESEALKQSVEQAVRDEVLPLAQAEGYEKGLLEASGEADRIRKQAKAYLELAQRYLWRVSQGRPGIVTFASVFARELFIPPLACNRINSFFIRNLTLLPEKKRS